MNAPRRRLGGGTSSPLGRAVAVDYVRDVAGAAVAVGFDPVADAGQGAVNQKPQLGTLLTGTPQRTSQLRIPATTPQSFGYIALPPYVGWVQLFPRIVLPNRATIPDDAFPERVGYFNNVDGIALPDASDSVNVIEWVKNYGTPFHTHVGVTLETRDDLINGTPFAEAAPVFLPVGLNIALFRGVDAATVWADVSVCHLTAIAAPRNEQIMYPTTKAPTS